MKHKTTVRFLSTVVLGFAVITTAFGPVRLPYVSAETSSVGSQGGVTGGGAPSFIGPPVPAPIFDDDNSDDDIVQLNNLRIESISSPSLPAVISASYDYGIRCQKFESLGSNRGSILPCPVPPTVLYQIRVDQDTRLFLRNRQRATLADFAVGDRMNVFGFMDRDTYTVDAIAVRNLDKPAAKKFIQLNNARIISGPSASAPPATIVVVQREISPCLDYGEGRGTGIPFPCPYGLEKDDAQLKTRNGAPVPELFYYPQPRKYLVQITSETRIVRRDRQPMELKDLEVGDIVNIYGYQDVSSKAITAVTVRDLSKPVRVSASLRVVVTDGSIVCAQSGAVFEKLSLNSITFPCGVLYNATVLLYGEDSNVVAKQTTESGAAFFENVRPGRYTAVASAPGYESNKEGVTLEAGATGQLFIALHPRSESITIKGESQLRGIVGQPFSAIYRAFGGNPPYSWGIGAGSLPPGLELSPGPLEDARPCPVPLSAATDAANVPDCVGRTTVSLKGTPTAAGAYKFELVVKDRSGASGSKTVAVEVAPAPTPTPLSCLPAIQVSPSGSYATLTAQGGNGQYAWSAPDGNPSSGSGRYFRVQYVIPGPDPSVKTVTVRSGDQSASCAVRVLPTALPPGTLSASCAAGPRIVLNWTSHPNANSNSIQKGDSYPDDPERFWEFIGQSVIGMDTRSYTDASIVPGVTYTYRVKYRPELPSNEVRLACN